LRIILLCALRVEFICYAIYYRSTKGVGATAPDFSKARELEDGLIVPLGKPKTNSRIKVWTNFFCPNQNKVKFLSVHTFVDAYHDLIHIIIILCHFVLQLQGNLLHNEYIVYNVEQIRMRYVVNVRFNFGT
jgi:poly [ADP-ribose] polymerase 2/3/4